MRRAQRWMITGFLVAAVLAAPIACYELTLLVTGSHESSRRAMANVADAIMHAVQMWLVLELFFTVKMRRLSALLRETKK